MLLNHKNWCENFRELVQENLLFPLLFVSYAISAKYVGCFAPQTVTFLFFQILFMPDLLLSLLLFSVSGFFVKSCRAILRMASLWAPEASLSKLYSFWQLFLVDAYLWFLRVILTLFWIFLLVACHRILYWSMLINIT